LTYLNEIIQKESLNDFINVKELNEIPEGSESLIFENLFSNLDRDFLIITRDLKRFQQIKDTMEFFLKSNTLFFPQWDCVPYDRISPNKTITSNRLETLSTLANNKRDRKIVLSTIQSACQRTLPIDEIKNKSINLKPGQVIAVTGGPGAYGGYVIQLAKADGLKVLADSNQDDESLLKDLGADIIISRDKNYVDQVRDHFPNGVDGLADGALLNEKAIDAVRDGGFFTSIRGFKGLPQRNINFSATWVTTYNCDKEKLDKIRQQVEDGLITLRVADVVDPDNAAEAHKRLEKGGTRGRMVIKWS